jgi:crossover junction endodeoxyribonuclease RuvC
MRVLGIDPAAAGPTGYGVVETDGRGYRVLDFGELRHGRGARPEERLAAVHELIARLVEKFAPDAVAIEAVFTALNMRTALKLAEVRGVVLLAAEQRHVPVHSYAPREVKAHVVGYGHADKRQMQQMVRALLNLRETPAHSLGADAADALAVALCHIYSAQARERLAAATAPGAVHDTRNSRHRGARIQISR